MTSTLVVIAANGRRATTKASPSTTLSEILQSACKSLRLNAEQYALKHKGKPLDLSLAFRLSGLPNHAQLELVQASRSPSVVSVALQLPPLEGRDTGGTRLTGKFASTTSIWQILRQFESGAATKASRSTDPTVTSLKDSSEASTLSSSSSSTSVPSLPSNPTFNFTERAIPIMASGSPTAAGAAAGSGAGRLCYQMPVVDFMGRELAGVEELQKTLAQLGFNGGSALLRLTFRQTERPLEDAIADISQYFITPATKQVGGEVEAGTLSVPASSSGDVELPTAAAAAAAAATPANENAPRDDIDMEDATSFPKTGTKEEKTASEPRPEAHVTTETLANSSANSSEPTWPQDRNISIFAPPTNQTPKATTFAHNPDDYETTVESARLHQSRLAASSRNKRLPSDKEVEEQEKARVAKVDAVKEVIVRVRLPDQSQVQSTFGKSDTAAMLYTFVRNMLKYDNQPFALRYTGEKGTQVIIEDGQRLLIKDFLFQGRVLVNFVWNETVPLGVKKDSALKQEYREQARDIEVVAPSSMQNPMNGDGEIQSTMFSGKDKPIERNHENKEQKMRKFLGKLTRK